MSQFPQRKTGHLHHGRFSAVGARYFITFIVSKRRPWFVAETAAFSALKIFQNWHTENNGHLLALTIMPDHLHVFFELGENQTVGRCVSCWKSQIRLKLKTADTWQRDFWEHRLRPDESIEDYGLYIFLNPYRANLLQAHQNWPWWWAPDEKLFQFSGHLKNGTPPQEWINYPDEYFEDLCVGE